MQISRNYRYKLCTLSQVKLMRSLIKLKYSRGHVSLQRSLEAQKQQEPTINTARPSRQQPPELLNLNFQRFAEVQSKNLEPYNKYLQSKQLLPKTRQKRTHKRGVSNGSTPYTRRQSRQLVSPGLSVYNFSMKLSQRKTNPLTSRREKPQQLFQMQDTKSRRDSQSIQALGKKSFQVLYPVGKGGFGKVWKVKMKKNQQIFAMKEMFKAKIIQKKSINSVMNERQLLAKVKHPFLVNMSYAFQDRQNLYLLMDYLDGGDLRYHIGKKRSFTEKETKFFLANIIIGLQYLHSKKIIHRDIKPENLVFDSHGYIRITDLGVSRELRQQNYQDTSGTPGYMAPQIMCRRNHACVADIFAVGVIGYQLMLGRRPYNGKNRKEIRDQILAKQVGIRIDQLPFRWSPDGADLINQMLMRNPEQRIGFKGIGQIKNHKWFADIDWTLIQAKKVKAPYIPLSIQEDYQEYKEQISEDTIMQNMEQNLLMLRDSEVQNLFDGYHFEKITFDKKKSTYTTNYTDHENPQTRR